MYSPSAAMAAFYLNIRDGEALIRDPQPYYFATAQAARDAAERTARHLLTTQPDFKLHDKHIEIADATGHPVSVVWIHDVAPELCITHAREDGTMLV